MDAARIDPSPLGKPITRVDGRLKVTGAAQYSAEFAPDKLVYAELIRSTIANGRVRSIDTSTAQSAPGVLGILTRQNAPKFRPYPDDLTKKGAPGESRVPLQDDEVHWSGQHLGVVVADTFERAVHAASLVRVSYESAPPLADMHDTLAQENALTPESSVSGEKLQVHRGDVAAALSAVADDAKIDVTYTTPIENHNPIETYSTTAEWEASDRLVVHDATRGIKQLQRIVANAFGLPLESVRVISPFVGGAFGSKGFQWSHVLLAVAAAQLVRRPVRLTLSRPQMFDSAGQRAQTVQTFSIAASNDGKLTALRHAILTHCSPVSEYTEAGGNMSPILYSCPNIEVSYRLVKLNYTTPCPMRAPGEAPGVFALECALDELAYKLGIDPLEFRLRNYAEKNEYQNKLWSSKRLRECYARGAEKFGWSRRLPQPRSMRADDGALLGWGMATAVYPATQRPAGAKATLTADGRVVIRSATHEIGTGTYTTMTQLAAEALGLPMESIRFELGDSEFPDAPNNGGSWQTSSVGPAVLAVCDEVKMKLIDLAINGTNAPFAGVAREDILAQNGMLILQQNASRNIGFGDLLARAGQSRLEAEAKTAVDKATRDEFSFQSFGALFVEVKVDPSLGQPRVTRVVGVYDLGRILNPRLARSQLLGGTLFGIGMALMEATVPDLKTGRIVNANLAEYHVPVCADIPESDFDFINQPDPHMADLGARGIGEIGIVGAPAAVGNAIFHATGKRVRNLPITLDKLM